MAKRKKTLLALLTELNIINSQITDTIFQKQKPQLKLLADCQQAAFVLGTELENWENKAKLTSEPKAHKTVSQRLVFLLEDYCENLYQLSLLNEESTLCRRLAKQLRKQLIQVSNGIRFELPEDKKEIVFLPYKASMWDSLESVWKAAVQDERCEAYVVPIPYFDRNADGSLGMMHDESSEYPKYVPILSWKEFSLKEHQPDIIYIHNPYDQYNYVTSVHPNFYASCLKQYTNKLVYIPYFTSLDSKVAKHFATLPGVFYANRVIVQSETARQIYIEALHNYEQEHHCENFFDKPEDKILALGSPKYDKVLLTEKETLTIPEEWKNRLNR